MKGLILRKAYFVCLVAVLLLTPSMLSQASAATVTDLVTFSATGFSATGGTPAASVSGSFTITFDPTQNYFNTTSGITLGSLTGITLDYPLSFDYSTTATTLPDSVPISAGELIVGGTFAGAGIVQYSPATNDFLIHILTFTTGATFQQLLYAQVAQGNNFFYTDLPNSGSGSVDVTPVPLPPSALLLGSGLLGLVGLKRFRKV